MRRAWRIGKIDSPAPRDLYCRSLVARLYIPDYSCGSGAIPMRFHLTIKCYICVAGVAHGIRCYKCGQYNEGVGSITPCINYTAHMLQECPSSNEWCIVSTTCISFSIQFIESSDAKHSVECDLMERRQVPSRKQEIIFYLLRSKIATLSKHSRSWKRRSPLNWSIP